MTLSACLVGKGSAQAVRIAVTHGGDRDSAGAIAGDLLGLHCPDEMLSHRRSAEIERADLIDGIAARLAAHSR